MKEVCYFCKRPIKINRLAGVFSFQGETHTFCKSIFCLIDFTDWEREHNEI